MATTPLSSLPGRSASSLTTATISKTSSRKVTTSNIRSHLATAVVATPASSKQKRKDVLAAASATTLSDEESTDYEEEAATIVKPFKNPSKSKKAVPISENVSSADDDIESPTKPGKQFYSQNFSSFAIGQPPIIRSGNSVNGNSSLSAQLLVPLSLKIEKPPPPIHLNNHLHLLHSQPPNMSNNNQQQQLLGPTDRMSKEKQKFFRHSAFNSDRGIKVSPPPPVSPATSARSSGGGGSVGLGGGSCLVTSQSIIDRLSSSSVNYHGVLMTPTISTNTAVLQINETNLSETSSSCSSSDDEDGSSTDSSSSSSDDSNSTSSSNSTTTNDADATTIKPTAEAPSNRSNGIIHNSSQASPAIAIAAAIQQPTSNNFPTSFNGANSWGFAAEAKKSVDIFRKVPPENERVFGNFDGIDKESLIKINNSTTSNNNSIATASSAKPSDSIKTTGHLKGLFDSLTHVFSTTDFTRSRLGVPNYKPDRRKDRKIGCSSQKVILKETRSTYRDYKQQRLQQQEQLKITSNSTAVSSRLLLNPLNKTDFNSFLHPSLNSFSTINRNNSRPAAKPEQFAKKYFTSPSTSAMITSFASSAQQRRFTLPDENQRPRQYDTSSDDNDDDVEHRRPSVQPTRLTPSNLVKNAINGQDHRTSMIPQQNSFSNYKLFGAISESNSIGFDSLSRDDGGGGGGITLLSGVSTSTTNYPIQPPISQSQLMGKRTM